METFNIFFLLFTPPNQNKKSLKCPQTEIFSLICLIPFLYTTKTQQIRKYSWNNLLSSTTTLCSRPPPLFSTHHPGATTLVSVQVLSGRVCIIFIYNSKVLFTLPPKTCSFSTPHKDNTHRLHYLPSNNLFSHPPEARLQVKKIKKTTIFHFLIAITQSNIFLDPAKICGPSEMRSRHNVGAGIQ